MGIFNRVKEIVRAIRFSGSPRLYGRYSAGAGDGEEIRIGNGLQISGGYLIATGTAINSVTSATTSNGTCDLWLNTLRVGVSTASGVRSVALGQSIASGALSLASGASTASEDYAFATGDSTTASGYASHSSGAGSVASGYAADASGDGTTASGYAAQSQGSVSTASADYSVATGRRAKAIHIGASVESDSQDADVESLTTNEKTFRFANGYRFLGGKAHFEGGISGVHGPYSNDAAAAAGGVEIQELYYHPDGRVYVRTV